jgi:hypothetical protein
VEHQQLGQISPQVGTRRTGYFRRKIGPFLIDTKLIVLICLQKMLIYCPSNRMSAKEAVKHKYFDDLDKDTLPAVAD